MEALKRLEKPLDKPYQYRKWMEDAGFVKVEEIIYDVALNTDDEKLKNLGIFQSDVLHDVLEGCSLYTYKKVLGWSDVAFQVQTAHVENELNGRWIHSSCRYIRTSLDCRRYQSSSLELATTQSRHQSQYSSTLVSRIRRMWTLMGWSWELLKSLLSPRVSAPTIVIPAPSRGLSSL